MDPFEVLEEVVESEPFDAEERRELVFLARMVLLLVLVVLLLLSEARDLAASALEVTTEAADSEYASDPMDCMEERPWLWPFCVLKFR